MKTKLHYYYLNIEHKEEAEVYQKLWEELGKKGLQCFDSFSIRKEDFYKKYVKPLDNTTINLDTKYLFNNQWNTEKVKTCEQGIRVFDWAENIFPNRKIKEGYYLDQTEEMAEIRKNTLKCGFCGKQYKWHRHLGTFCTNCIGSKYLELNELPLLRLLPVNEDTQRVPLSSTEREHLTKIYINKRKEG